MSENIKFKIDGVETEVPKGTLVIRAAEQLGIEIPRFCDHPLLEPVGACRQCLVDVSMPDREGNVRPMPKPQASCTLEAAPGMEVFTQETSPVAEKAQRGMLELLLINHPLDCPVCDKGGECPLQNQSLSHGDAESRFIDVKRTFAKPIKVSTQILLDRERCVLCQRCTRFSEQIAGDNFIALQERGAEQQIGRFDEGILGFAQEPVGGCGGYEPKQVGLVDSRDVSGANNPDIITESARAATPAGEAPVGAATADESGQLFSSYFSGNTIQICPVGALTSSAYRFRSRPFDLVSTPAISEHDSSGSAIRVDHRRGTVLRRLAGDDPVVNEEWITDKDRFAFTWQSAKGRLSTPLIRERDAAGNRGELRPASWNEAFAFAANGLRKAALLDDRGQGGVGVLPGGRLTIEDNYAYAKFARVALGTNDIDARARVSSDEELDFLGANVAGSGIGVTFGDLEKARVVLLAGFEPEEEGGVVFLRLRKAARSGKLATFAVAPFASRGLARIGNVGATLIPAVPGTEAEILAAIGANQDADHVPSEVAAAASALVEAGDQAIIIVGERLAASPGALTAAQNLAAQTGAKLVWIPRRIGERAAVEMGGLPNLLPGGRPVVDSAARVDMAAVWGVDSLPTTPGRNADQMIDALNTGQLRGVVVGGLQLTDLASPSAARSALAAADFVLSLEVRESDVTELADVVLPVAPPAERAGAYWNWEGRVRPFGRALETSALPDHRVLSMLAEQLGAPLNVAELASIRGEIDQIGPWDGNRVATPSAGAAEPVVLGAQEAVLATWHLLLDDGALQIAEPFLAGTAKTPVARVSQATATNLNLGSATQVRVSTNSGTITLPLVVCDMSDGVVWVPQNSPGSKVNQTLEARSGDVVAVRAVPSEGKGA